MSQIVIWNDFDLRNFRYASIYNQVVILLEDLYDVRDAIISEERVIEFFKDEESLVFLYSGQAFMQEIFSVIWFFGIFVI